MHQVASGLGEEGFGRPANARGCVGFSAESNYRAVMHIEYLRSNGVVNAKGYGREAFSWLANSRMANSLDYTNKGKTKG
jgi:hypothetical protein